MKFSRVVPAIAGTGCLVLVLGVSAAHAQSNPSDPGATTGAAGQSQTGGAGQTGAAGQTQAGATTGSEGANGSASMADKKFVKTAMQGSMAEIKLGQLAAQKGGSEDVKQFGQRMVDDHTKLSEQMKPVASQLGVTPPDDLGMMHKGIEKKLQGKTGAEFDKTYMQAMVKDHQKDLSEFRKEASSGKSQAVKDAASQGAQVIEEHLKMAQQIAQKVGASGGNGSDTTSSGGSSNGGSSGGGSSPQ